MNLKCIERKILQQKPRVIKLCIKIQGDSYVVGVLSFNRTKEELAYCLSYSSKALLEQDSYDKNGILLRAEALRLDHVTWHKKVIQVKTVKLHNKEERICQIENFHNSSYQAVRPIYVECLKLDMNLPLLPKESEYEKSFKDSDIKEVLSINNGEFSLIFLLINSDEETDAVMQYSYVGTVILKNIFMNASSNVERIENIWDKTDLLIIVINKIYYLDIKNTKLENNIRLFNYERPIKGLEKLINS